jgi:hypothetical protein
MNPKRRQCIFIASPLLINESSTQPRALPRPMRDYWDYILTTLGLESGNVSFDW